MTCLSKKDEAAQVLDNPRASKEEVDRAKEVIFSPSCLGCRNPLTRQLSIDDIMCTEK